MEVKISAKKKSENDIACFHENRKMLDHKFKPSSIKIPKASINKKKSKGKA